MTYWRASTVWNENFNRLAKLIRKLDKYHIVAESCALQCDNSTSEKALYVFLPLVLRWDFCLCPSVYQTRALWQNERKICPYFYAMRKIIQSSLWEEEWLVGATTSIWNFGSTVPRWSEIAYFEPIIARSASSVRPSDKSSINTNRKSPTRFPTSLRWSPYVAPKSPKGGLKNAKRPFFLYNRTSLEESLLQSIFVWKLSAAKL